MTEFIFYIIGYIIVAVFYYVVNTTKWGYKIATGWFENYEEHSKAYWVYASLKAGFFSWLAILFIIAFALVMGVYMLDKYIKSKIDK